MVWLIRKLFWLALFVAATFAFIVLFEHGTQNYADNARKEFEALKTYVTTKAERRKDESDRIGQ